MEFKGIESGVRPGAENMALDSKLLDLACGSGAFFFHSYAWSRPTLSLGYFQKLEDVAVDTSRVDVVTRFTGGGAILHDRELTFSLAVPPEHPVAKLDVNDSYLELTRPLLFWLRGFGLTAEFRGECPASKPANCFAGAACPDIVVNGKKIFGSAQRRKNGGILQHGSLLLDIDNGLWQAVFGSQLGEGFTSAKAEGLDPALLTPEGLKQAYQQAWRVVFQPVDIEQSQKSQPA
jgi:lipoate-protein ligase A